MNKTVPLVSVILPNYNHSLYLEERIDSILNQTFQDFELIILDDCSTDNSHTVIDKYSTHKNISHIEYNKENSGSTFKQWQKGFELSKGKYIWIAESDDYSDETVLEKLVPILEKEKDIVLAYVGSHLVDQDGVNLPHDWDRFDGGKEVKIYLGTEFVLNKMLTRTSLYNSGMVLFRKEILSQIDDSYTQYRSCGDWLFWCRLCMCGKVAQCGEKLNYFRQHLNKVTARAESSGLRFSEGKYVVKEIADMLELTPFQRRIVVGEFVKNVKRFPNFKDERVKESVLTEVKDFLGFKNWYVFAYRIDKILNFSKLNISKNK